MGFEGVVYTHCNPLVILFQGSYSLEKLLNFGCRLEKSFNLAKVLEKSVNF